MPQLQNAVENHEDHEDDEGSGAVPFHSVIALAVEDVAGDDQGEDDGVDDPVHCLGDDVVQRSEAGELIEEERQDRDHGQKFGGSECDVDGFGHLCMQESAVCELVEERGYCAEEGDDGEEFQDEAAAPDAGSGGIVSSGARRFGAYEEATDDGGCAAEHQELDGDSEAGGLTGFDQQQAHEAGGVEHDAHQASPDAGVALWRQDGKGASIGSDCLSIFRHFKSLEELED